MKLFKKSLSFFLVMLLLLSSLSIIVSAESDETDLENVISESENFTEITSAKIVKNSEQNEAELQVEVKNISKTKLQNISVFIADFDDTIIKFADSAAYIDYNAGSIYYFADINELNPGATKTVIFELSDVPKENYAKVDLAISYYPDSSTVYAGMNNEMNSSFDKFSDVLAQKNSDSKLDIIVRFLKQSGFVKIFENPKVIIMLLISFVLMYLAIVKKFEPLLLLPIAFGMLLTNLPGADVFHQEFFANGHVHWEFFSEGSAGLIDYLYLGVKLGIYPCLIFLGIGAMTDFAPLIANPKSLLLGAAAQLGIFITYIGATLLGFTSSEASSIGIIGGADGPTAIYVTSLLSPELLGPIAIAAYSYMALVPFIQPPIMRLLTTEDERKIVMKEMRTVSKTEKIIFPIVVTVFVSLLVPSATPLIGALMLGNLMKESGVVDRIAKAASNELMNIVTIFLGISVGATATADAFLSWKTLMILSMGIVAFSFGTAGGVLLAKFMNLFSKNKINPLIGSAGVSAVPMAARVSQVEGQKANPSNYLLMHAMGPNVSGVIGSAIAAGVLIALFA